MEVIDEIKTGFKKTKIGWIPNDWEIKKISDIAKIDSNSLSSNTNKSYQFKYISLSNIDKGKLNDNLEIYTFSDAPSRARRIIIKGSILMSTVRPNLKSFFRIKNDPDNIIASTGFAVIDVNKECDGEFLYQNLFSQNLEAQFYAFVVGSNYPAINSSDVKALKIPFPSLVEQKKISSILSDWDCAIGKTQSLIEKLRLRKKGLMQKIFKGEKQLPKANYEALPRWKIRKLSFYLELSNKKNFDMKFQKRDVLSVSGEFGVVNQIELQGRSFAGASVANYGLVEKGDIVYTKSPLKSNPYGIIKVNKGKSGIVSTLYAIYKCKDSVSGVFLDYYFQLDDNVNSYLRPLVQKGTKNDMKINNEKVLSGDIFFPSLEEQELIVFFFKSIDVEIECYENYLEQLKVQKKGLMQQLLTGKVRVKI